MRPFADTSPRSGRVEAVVAAAALLAVLTGADPAPGQHLPVEAEAKSIVVDAGEPGWVTALSLATGESVVVWTETDVEVGAPDVGGRAVPDVEVGALIARFAGSAPFGWPTGPTVWTAPDTGRLAFGINGHVGHRMEGVAKVRVASVETVRPAFAPPSVELDRTGGAVRVRWRDRAGFGIDRKSLSFRLTTSHGTVYHLGAWAPVGERGAVLPLPPPVSLPPGVHVLSATIADRLGNRSTRSTITFDTGG